MTKAGAVTVSIPQYFLWLLFFPLFKLHKDHSQKNVLVYHSVHILFDRDFNAGSVSLSCSYSVQQRGERAVEKIQQPVVPPRQDFAAPGVAQPRGHYPGLLL